MHTENAHEFERARLRLGDEVIQLHDLWAQWKALYGSGAETVAILNGCAPWFFGQLQRVLLRDIVLGAARLTDEVLQKGKRNLVLATLLEDPALKESAQVREQLRAAIERATTAALPLRGHRHKLIAHLDHAVAVGEAELLAKFSRLDLEAAVSRVGEAFRFHSLHVRGVDLQLDVSSRGDARILVEVLRGSDRWKRLQQLHLSATDTRQLG